ncbi:MAG: MATE family efflux transporter [Gracilibacteraceae bacterium]|jgi:putative MATE family efflux protein|nr:MATE family efflux transporter [Gracilibacteraceae bacterium]
MIPAIIANLVTAVYNIVDQIFIGNSVGLLGNAATNIAFPIAMICTAVALMTGVGAATGFNLAAGKGETVAAGKIVGSAIVLMLAAGIIIAAAVLLFLTPVVYAFGATETVFPYAKTYMFITAWSVPMAIFGTGGSIIIRSDGSPNFALGSVLSGALINVVLDAYFIFVLRMGMAGAAWATVIGQTCTGILVGLYFTRFKTIRLRRGFFAWDPSLTGRICALGMGPFVNNTSMFIVQIMLNNALNRYGAASVYGSDIPLACVGVISKLNAIVGAVVAGIAQGVQPVISYNYGAKKYKRVTEASIIAITVMLAFSGAVFLCCQLFPRQLVSIFGSGSELYYRFSEMYLRIFMFLIGVNGIQVAGGSIFTAMGKAKLSVFISLTRQILFLPPLICLLPMFFGLNGILYAGPIADGMCVLAAFFLLLREWV